MSKYNFDQVVERRHTYSYKWDTKENVLPMWVADMDFPVLSDIVDAIKERADINSYGYIYAPEEYFLAYKNWWKRRHNVDLKTSDMLFSTGVVASIDCILKHMIPPQSGVVLQTPVYHTFFHCLNNNGHKLLENKLIYENGEYKIDFDNLEELFKLKETKAFILCNPHNPVGRIWNKEELLKIIDLCTKNNVLLISDEIHCDIVEPGQQYVPILSLTDRAIALFAGSKVFNIASLQSSVVVCPNKEMREQLSSFLGQDDIGEPNYFAPAANIAAFNNGDQYVDELNSYLFENKKYVQSFIEKELPHLRLIDNKATYLLWLDISYYSSDSDDFVKKMQETTGLYVSSGASFGDSRFLRINIATKKANVIDACMRLKTFIDKNY